MKSLQPAASALPGASAEGCCVRKGPAPATGYRLALCPAATASESTLSNIMNENKILSPKLYWVRLLRKKDIALPQAEDAIVLYQVSCTQNCLWVF